MAVRIISADYIFNGNKFLTDVAIVMEDDVVKEIVDLDEVDDVEKYQGVICPGFINTHCHLELSHLKGKIPTGTGLISFISKVVQCRAMDQNVIDQAILTSDENMWQNGIQAVGDISNQVDTIFCKKRSKIKYHTFVELFDFMNEKLIPELTAPQIEAFHEFQSTGLSASAVPHAPYSVSPTLFNRIHDLNDSDAIISIHNQETKDENDYFINKTGGFTEFFINFKIDNSNFEPIGQSSIHYALNHLESVHPTLFVHNTTTSKEDILAARTHIKRPFWVTCANANLYIENKLPDYQTFIETGAVMTIGTDSLSSNWQLSVWDEIKTIHRYNSYIGLETLLRWATRNGAEALSMNKSLGSIEAGKTPGLILIQNASPDHFIDSTIKRII